jgi:hypothetical protein
MAGAVSDESQVLCWADLHDAVSRHRNTRRRRRRQRRCGPVCSCQSHNPGVYEAAPETIIPVRIRAGPLRIKPTHCGDDWVSERPTDLTQCNAFLPRHSLAQAVPPRSARQPEPSLSVFPPWCAAPKQNKPSSPPKLTDQKRLGQTVTSLHLGFPERKRSEARPGAFRVFPTQLVNSGCTVVR